MPFSNDQSTQNYGPSTQCYGIPNKPRIARVTKRPLRLTPGTTAALVKIHVVLPDEVLIPRVPVATVEIRRQHIEPPKVSVTAEATK